MLVIRVTTISFNGSNFCHFRKGADKMMLHIERFFLLLKF